MADATSVEDRINLHQLMELKAVFERADTDGGGSLDIDEFLEAFGGVLGKNLSRASAARTHPPLAAACAALAPLWKAVG